MTTLYRTDIDRPLTSILADGFDDHVMTEIVKRTDTSQHEKDEATKIPQCMVYQMQKRREELAEMEKNALNVTLEDFRL